MSNNTPAFDFRLANPIVCNPEDGPGRFSVDTLHRAASTLQLFSSLIGGSQDGINEVFSDDDRTYALCLQLDGIALTLRAIADSLGERRKLDRDGNLIESLKGIRTACDTAKAAVDTDGGGTETIFESLKLIRAIAVQELNELGGAQ
ncbi:MAG: hypothetical protein V9G98_14275 [Candidatus Competibacter sp.]